MSSGAPTPPARGELGTLARLAWPVVVGQLGLMLMGVVDTIMVGQLDGQALAGVGLGHTWSFAWMALGMGAAMGLDPAITQAWGARDDAAFGRAMAHGAVILAMLLPPIMLLHVPAEPVLRVLAQPEGILPLTGRYSRIVALSAPAMLAWGLLRQALQAQGRMWPATWLALGGNLLNVLANGVLLYGWGTGVSMGPIGSAWATLLVRWALMLSLAWLAREEVGLVVRGLRDLSWVRLRALASVALPVAFQTSLEIWAFTSATFLVGQFGDVAVAAHSITLNLAALSFMVPMGIGAAAATRVGNLVGEGRDWVATAWLAIGGGGLVMLFGAAVFTTIPETLAAIYVPGDPAVIALTASLLPVAAAFSVFDGVQVVAFGVLRGLGDTRAPAAANVVAFYVFGLPFGAWLAMEQGFGPQGIWIGTAVGLAIVSALLVWRIRWRAMRGAIRVTA